jgi:hypothetical protein
MKTMLIGFIVAGLFGLANVALATAPFDPSALEPCINGAVSASGRYPTQAEEDTARAEVQRLDRAMSGQVSASGR